MAEPQASLVRDLKLRLAAVRKPCPTPAQQRTWGGWRIPWWLTFLGFLTIVGGVMYMDQQSLAQALASSDWWWGVALLLTALFMVSGRFNRFLAVRAYARRLSCDERFLLLEYEAYLGREIARATKDPALGGSAEIARLNQLRRRMQGLLDGHSLNIMRPTALSQDIALTEHALVSLGDSPALAGRDLESPPTGGVSRQEAQPESAEKPDPQSSN